MHKQYDIFISYRRDGGKNFARILKPELEKRGFQDRVFLDFDELKDGKFDKRIMDAIDSAPIFIIILSDGCLDRCVNENDWVRQEILHALESNKHIIPVVCDKTFSDFPANIPEEIRKGLGQHQFTQIDTDTLLRASVNELVEYRIDPVLKKDDNNIAKSNDLGAEIHILTDADCNVMRFGKQIGAAKVNEENIIRLLKGNHLLDFVSVEYSDIKQTLKYSVPDNDYSDFIEVKLQDYIKDKKKQVRTTETKPKVIENEKKRKEALDINKKQNINKSIIKNSEKDKSELLNKKLVPYQNRDKKWGFKDETGNIVIPCKWKYAGYVREGLGRVKDGNGKWGFIDKTGQVVIPCKWNDVEYFNEGLAGVRDDNGKWGFIDKTGLVVIPCKWRSVGSFSEGLARARDDNGKWGFIDKTGLVVIPCKWRSVGSFSEGLARARDDNGKWGFIDKAGTVVIPCKWESVDDFNEGLAVVKKCTGILNKTLNCGFIDKIGKVVIPCKWNLAHSFKNGEAHVRDEGWFYTIDKTGKVLRNGWS